MYLVYSTYMNIQLYRLSVREKRTVMLTIQILPVLQRTAVMMMRLVRLEREREAMMALIVKLILGHCLVISL